MQSCLSSPVSQHSIHDKKKLCCFIWSYIVHVWFKLGRVSAFICAKSKKENYKNLMISAAIICLPLLSIAPKQFYSDKNQKTSREKQALTSSLSSQLHVFEFVFKSTSDQNLVLVLFVTRQEIIKHLFVNLHLWCCFACQSEILICHVSITNGLPLVTRRGPCVTHTWQNIL